MYLHTSRFVFFNIEAGKSDFMISTTETEGNENEKTFVPFCSLQNQYHSLVPINILYDSVYFLYFLYHIYADMYFCLFFLLESFPLSLYFLFRLNSRLVRDFYEWMKYFNIAKINRSNFMDIEWNILWTLVLLITF